MPQRPPDQPHHRSFRTPQSGDTTAELPNNGGTPLSLSARLQLQAAGRRDYSCRLIRAGRIRRADNTPGPYEIPADVIQAAVDAGRFNSRAAFVDHAGWFDGPSLRNLAGITLGATYNAADKAAEATIRLYDNPAGEIVRKLFDQVLSDADAGDPVPDIGLSLVFYPRWKAHPDGTLGNADAPLILAEFRHVESVDFVFQPAADGRVREALTALSALSEAPNQSVGAAPRRVPAHGRPERTHTMTDEIRTATVGAQHAAPQPETLANDWLAASRDATTEAIISASGLPRNVQAHLRAQSYETPHDLRAAIELQREILADLHADRVVQVGGDPPRSSGISLGRAPLEQVEAAFQCLMEGVSPPTGVAPLSGVRELYHLLSGDYDMHGIFHGDRIQLANVTCATMANITANALNKTVVNQFQNYPHWWERITSEQDFTNLQQVKWITLGACASCPRSRKAPPTPN